MSRSLSTLARFSSLRPVSSPLARCFSSSPSLAKTWCVRNLPFTVTENDLSDYFYDKIGLRSEVKIPGGERMRKGVKVKWSKGYAFLSAPDSFDGRILSLSGAEIDGRPCHIEEYVVQEKEVNWAKDMDKWARDEGAAPISGNKGLPF